MIMGYAAFGTDVSGGSAPTPPSYLTPKDTQGVAR